MNNSLKFIKSRISIEQTDKIPINGWDKAEVINPINQYIKILPDYEQKLKENNEITLTATCDIGNSDITIKYNPKAKFDYFTTKSTTHDGTLLFTLQAIEELIFRPFQLATLPKDSGINKNNFTEYDYQYEIGDILIHRDFGMKKINGHIWHGETDTIVLPIKFKCTRH